MRTNRVAWFLTALAALIQSGIPAGAAPRKLPRYELVAAQTWQLTPPNGERFDASGLLLAQDGALLTVNDRGEGVYRIEFSGGTNAARLTPVTNWFTAAQLAPFATDKVGRYDWEGIAQDDSGRLYLCEEGNRWIIRCDPRSGTCERLEIDWSPVRKYFSSDRNASFEGIAIGGGRLYVANERSRGVLIQVDLTTRHVERVFHVRPSTNQARDVHYSDLCWFGGELWVLLRESRVVLRVDPAGPDVLAEFSFADMERKREVLYNWRVPTSTMEGLAVDADCIWLVTDNNGEGRWVDREDTRPTLFKCLRPDKLRR
jgi:hypothetical protein